MTGRQLRDLPTLGLAYDLDLFQIVAGAGDDLLVRDEELVHIEDGAEYGAANDPRWIDPFGPKTAHRTSYFVAGGSASPRSCTAFRQ
jgi:hypothetical protein